MSEKGLPWKKLFESARKYSQNPLQTHTTVSVGGSPLYSFRSTVYPKIQKNRKKTLSIVCVSDWETEQGWWREREWVRDRVTEKNYSAKRTKDGQLARPSLLLYTTHIHSHTRFFSHSCAKQTFLNKTAQFATVHKIWGRKTRRLVRSANYELFVA